MWTSEEKNVETKKKRCFPTLFDDPRKLTRKSSSGCYEINAGAEKHSDFKQSTLYNRSIEGFKPTIANLDLEKEFDWLEHHPIPDLQTLDLDAVDRSCIARHVTKKKEGTEEEEEQVISIKIVFPKFYPSALPSFQFLPETTLPDERRSAILKAVSKVAQFNMIHGHLCLEKCLRKVIQIQAQLEKEAVDKEEREKEAKKEKEEDVQKENNQEPTTDSEKNTSEEIQKKAKDEIIENIKEKLEGNTEKLQEKYKIEEEFSLLKAKFLTSFTKDKLKNNILQRAKTVDDVHDEGEVKAHHMAVEIAPFSGHLALDLEKGLSFSPSPVKMEDVMEILRKHQYENLETSDLMTATDFAQLVDHMPPKYSCCRWKLLYSTMKHGISISTLFNNVASDTPTLIVVEDSNRYVFGGFMTGKWSIKNTFTGTGESFLYKLSPKFDVYKWSTLNHQIQTSTHKSMMMGGGQSVGLMLDADLEYGQSQMCDTFLNSCLASEEYFNIVVVEVW
eukprot:CAMPEP_0174278154 /NCGR_PEP_ID=MMETSP0439-20130205/61318_1 /TAXON_ID=0 /ORGANISM="Stereomyxa ramosa, Strain Chinc5" /LENGTH=502 /DNA_ID=CAMNT_0015370533 /DNA_START=972 /DNA_END=2477 /DNA_ORIENTATION=-